MTTYTLRRERGRGTDASACRADCWMLSIPPQAPPQCPHKPLTSLSVRPLIPPQYLLNTPPSYPLISLPPLAHVIMRRGKLRQVDSWMGGGGGFRLGRRFFPDGATCTTRGRGGRSDTGRTHTHTHSNLPTNPPQPLLPTHPTPSSPLLEPSGA